MQGYEVLYDGRDTIQPYRVKLSKYYVYFAKTKKEVEEYLKEKVEKVEYVVY